MQNSSGTLLYRHSDRGIEVLLVHASGNYNRRAAWSIPKGIPQDEESLEDAARRETSEETGVEAGDLVALSFIDYRKSRKQVHCFAGLAPRNAAPKPLSWEVDRAEFVTMDDARRLLHPDQVPFLDRLEQVLSRT